MPGAWRDPGLMDRQVLRQSLKSWPSEKAGCPTSRSFFARCGIPLVFPSDSRFIDRLSGQHRWNPTSREKRARYGAPGLGQGTRGRPCGTHAASKAPFSCAGLKARSPGLESGAGPIWRRNPRSTLSFFIAWLERLRLQRRRVVRVERRPGLRRSLRRQRHNGQRRRVVLPALGQRRRPR
jgi:hypothetical protein